MWESGFVWAKVDGIDICNCYSSPNDQIRNSEFSDAKECSPMIIAGDFNTWAVELDTMLMNGIECEPFWNHSPLWTTKYFPTMVGCLPSVNRNWLNY